MKRKTQFEQKRKMLGYETKTNTLRLLLIHEETARKFLDVINPEDIAAWQPGFALAWRIYRDALIAGPAPSKAFMIQSIREAAEESPDLFDEDVIREAIELVRAAFKMSATADLIEKGIANANRMVQEQIYVNAVADYDSAHVPADIPDFFQKIQERVVSSSPSTAAQAGELFGLDWKEKILVQRRQTHVRVYDRILGGGVAPGWVVGFAAPFGGGKTSLATDGPAAIIKNEPPDDDGRLPVVAIFSFETPKTEWQLRLLSCYARIPNQRLQEQGYKGLRMKDEAPIGYELDEFKGGKLISERGRADRAAKAMRGRIVLFDISNMEDENKSVKSMQAIANAVRTLNTEKTYVHSVWVDHTSALVDHIIATSDGKLGREDRADLIRELPRTLRKDVAKKFNVPVILLAQLSGAANARSPAAPMGGTDVEGCKSFGMYLDINVVSGRMTNDAYCAWYSDKNRHSQIIPRIIAKFDGRYYHFSDADEEMTIDNNTRQFVKRKEADKYGGTKYTPIPSDQPQPPKNKNINV